MRTISDGPEARDEANDGSERRRPPRFIDRSKVPQLDEKDILEKFVSGSGPGGQSVNKAVNACQIKHLPTGLVIKVHQTRSLEQNRKLAREILQTKLDNMVNGEDSVEGQKRRLALYRQSIRQQESEKRRRMKESFKAKLAAEAKAAEGL